MTSLLTCPLLTSSQQSACASMWLTCGRACIPSDVRGGLPLQGIYRSPTHPLQLSEDGACADGCMHSTHACTALLAMKAPPDESAEATPPHACPNMP